MEILGKVLSEKTEAIYKDITEGLIYPIKIFKRSSFSCAFSFRMVLTHCQPLVNNFFQSKKKIAMIKDEHYGKM